MNWLKIKYAILTVAIFVPLFWSFLTIRNFYPFAAWNVMMAGGDLQRGRTYCILRGETVAGEVVEIRPITLTNALYSRIWTMVNATVDNQAFKLPNIHPANEELLRESGGVENLAPSAPPRLIAIRLDMYRWEGGCYAVYDQFIESWRKEL